MAKNKLLKFSEIDKMDFVFQPKIEKVEIDSNLKNNWNKKVFKNNNEIILELACGKAEYTIELAKKHKDKNFIGIDIKGERIWKGAKEKIEHNLNNVCFLRIPIERITNFFGNNEVSKIYVIFPDPFLKKRMSKKRLTHTSFIQKYSQILKKDGNITLKTDSDELYFFTIKEIKKNNLCIIDNINNLYSSKKKCDEFNITTFYEKKFLSAGKKTKWLTFKY